MKNLADCRLYAFVDTAYLRDRSPAELAAQLADGGADLIQFRAKDWTVDRIARTAESLCNVCQRFGVGLVINDHLDVAMTVGAPLAHLGQEDLSATGHSHLSAFLPPDSRLRVGLSSHAPAQAERALQAGASYVAIGPVFATPTKPGRPPVTLDYVRWAAAHLGDIPWFAIGGIHLGNVDDVVAAGARRICVVSAILNADDPSMACRQFRERLPA